MTEISIITPCYNTSKFIGRCIESVIAQTFSDWELIIVDDGSKDNSLYICKGYAAVDSRIKVYHKENGGVSSARNFGLTKVSGKWITFLDSDDTLPDDALDHLFKCANLNQKNTEIVFCGYNIIGGDDKLDIPKKIYVTTGRKLAMELFQPSDYPYQGYICSKLFKREIIDKHNIQFDEKIIYNEDRLFTFEFLSHCDSGVYSTVPVYNYYKTGESAMASINGPNYWKFETDLDAFVKMCNLASDAGDIQLLNAARHGTYQSYLKNNALNKTWGKKSKNTRDRLHKKFLGAVPFHVVIRYKLKEFTNWCRFKLYNIAIKYGLR